MTKGLTTEILELSDHGISTIMENWSIATIFTKKHKREKISAAIRSFLFKKQTSCVYCDATANLVIDQIDPVIYGGENDIRNLTVSCNKCNSHKGSYPINIFYLSMLKKRDAVFNQTISYVFILRRLRVKRYIVNGHLYSQSRLTEKILANRCAHSYYTKIINSILHKKYLIHAE